MDNKTIILTRGIPASGKSTWSKNFVASNPHSLRVNRDDIRFSAFGSYTGLTPEQENTVTKIERGIVEKALDSEYSVVIDAMHLRPKYIREWMKFADRKGAELVIEDFPISLEDALQRDSQRDRSVGEVALRNIWNKYTNNGKFLEVQYSPVDLETLAPYVPLEDRPKAIIVDIDGTVAHNDGHRGWYEYDKVADDKPKDKVISVVESMVSQGYYPVFLSGRSDDCYNETIEWLNRHMPFEVNTLFMRKAGDYRKDSLIKYEIFNEHVRDNYNIVVAFDDRKQVTEMWRSIGLTVLQVEFGDY